MPDIDIEGKTYVYDSGYSFETGSKNYRYIFKPKPWYGRQYKGLEISMSLVMHYLNLEYGVDNMEYKLLTDLIAIDERTDSESEAFSRIFEIEKKLLPLCVKVNNPTDEELILLKKILTETVKYMSLTPDSIIINFIKRIFLQKLEDLTEQHSYRSNSPLQRSRQRSRSRSRSPLRPPPSPRTSKHTYFFKPKKSKKQKSQSRKKKSHKKSAKRHKNKVYHKIVFLH